MYVCVRVRTCLCACVHVCMCVHVCVWVKFELIFQHILIVQSFDAMNSQRQALKNPCTYHMKFLFGDAICAI